MNSSIEARVSAEMPIIPDDVVDLVKMVDEGRSMNRIFNRLMSSSLAEGIETKHDLQGDDMRVLFHTLSRPLLRSMLLKTVGMDLYDKDIAEDNWSHVYAVKGGGAYVATIHVRRRLGQFLCPREIREFIRMLERYARAVDAYDDCVVNDYLVKPGPLGDDLTFSQKVDDEMRSASEKHFKEYDPRYARPRFGGLPPRLVETPRDMSKNIRHLIAMFEKRCAGREEDEEVFQWQAPMMVGNAANLRNRTSVHYHDSSMSSTSKVWALTISCLRMMGVLARVQVAPLFCAWTLDQMDLGEVLGTILGGTLLPGDGFNVKQPGTRGGGPEIREDGLEEAKTEVFYWRGWFQENLRHSIADVHRPGQVLAGLRAYVATLEQYKARADELRERIQRAEEERETAMREAIQNAEQVEETLASLREYNRATEALDDPFFDFDF